MPDNRNISCGVMRDTVCADINRIMDSCRDKDCYENVRVFLTDYGQELIEKSGNVRVKNAEVISVGIESESLGFNKGFYQIYLKFYVKITVEVCACIGKPSETEGLAVCTKKLVLFGGESGANVFRSNPDNSGFCHSEVCRRVNNKEPTVSVEVLDPVVLDASVCDICHHQHCECCECESVPQCVCDSINGVLCDCDNGKGLFVTLGFFSVVRIERRGQYLVSAAEYSVPDKECVTDDDECPCDRFKKMPFPEKEFRISGAGPICGCK